VTPILIFRQITVVKPGLASLAGLANNGSGVVYLGCQEETEGMLLVSDDYNMTSGAPAAMPAELIMY
jgi:hypothetical protein